MVYVRGGTQTEMQEREDERMNLGGSSAERREMTKAGLQNAREAILAALVAAVAEPAEAAFAGSTPKTGRTETTPATAVGAAIAA
jgi:hypothetical protein